MERQGLSEGGSTVDAERIRGLYKRADPSKWLPDGDVLLDVVRGVVEDEGERGERLELQYEGSRWLVLCVAPFFFAHSTVSQLEAVNTTLSTLKT